MPERRKLKYHPNLEPLEPIMVLSALALGRAPVRPPAARPHEGGAISAAAVKPNFGFLVYRITQPNRFNNHFVPPFGHVLVQGLQPVPGETYNVLYVTVRNGTARTFDASDDMRVRLHDQRDYTPILTGDQKWIPGQNYTFYVLTKRYYPIGNQVSGGFQFILDGAWSVAIPGPSGIFLRLKYNPNTIDRVLDHIVTGGAGAQGGVGVRFGMPDTAVWEFLSAKTRKPDFGGYF